jgi:hypothetical protein
MLMKKINYVKGMLKTKSRSQFVFLFLFFFKHKDLLNNFSLRKEKDAKKKTLQKTEDFPAFLIAADNPKRCNRYSAAAFWVGR